MRDVSEGVLCKGSHLETMEACIGGEEVGRKQGVKCDGYRACQREPDGGGREGEEGQEGIGEGWSVQEWAL